MERNLIKISFAVITFLVVFLGALINKFSDYVPAFVKKTFLYGKFSYKGKSRTIQVPKVWFRHFYVFASVFFLFGSVLMSLVYFVLGDAPDFVKSILDYFASDNRHATVSATAALTAVVLLTIQSWKRMYETYYVSVFSDSKIDISHYFLGFFHYFGALLAILAEAPGFCRDTSEYEPVQYTVYLSVISVIFLWASWQQLTAAVILGNLRKNKKGNVVSLKHSIPSGHLFELVSSPHLMCEIIMYTLLTIILWGNSTWLYIYFWVLSNQVETAMLSHWWYQSEFKDYPKQRKAIIPYIF